MSPTYSALHKKNFQTLLYDAVYMLYLGVDLNCDDFTDDVIHTCIRSSILNSMLSIECAATILIHTMDLPKPIYEEIEKLSPLAKFEFFLHRKSPEISFDRGCKQVQALAELKKMRDDYVHPKVKIKEYTECKEGVWVADLGESKILKFSKDIDCWKARDAILALKVVNDFFNIYLMDWCRFNKNQIIQLLIHDEKAEIENPPCSSIDFFGALDRAVLKWGIDFKFLGKEVIGDGESYTNRSSFTVTTGANDQELIDQLGI